MIKLDRDLRMSNYKDFSKAIKENGFSINNFYDIRFEFRDGSDLAKEISDHPNIEWPFVKNDLMRLFADETVLPGLQMSTGEYRINNTPTLKYVYGSVFSEVNCSFISDANSQIRNVFDIWTRFMYGYTTKKGVNDLLPIFSSVESDKFRTQYRDEYAVDMLIIKYERHASSNKNRGFEPYSVSDIIPGIRGDSADGSSGFFKAIPVYAVKLFNAFPSNISSTPLNSGTSELVKNSITFEYETHSTTALTADDMNGFHDAVNDGSTTQSFLQALFNI